MGQAIGNILPLALAVAISPIPIIAIVLTLGTPRARSNGVAFTIGWLAGLAIVGTVVLLASSGNATQDSGGPATWTNVLQLVLGALFLVLAVHAWRGRPKTGEAAALPKWMSTLDTFTAGKMLGLGLLLSAVNPKNLALTVSAATTIAQVGISDGKEASALAVFVLIGSLTIIAPVVIYFTMGTRAKRILDELNGFMAAHNGAIMTVLFLVLAAKLIGEAIAGFSS